MNTITTERFGLFVGVLAVIVTAWALFKRMQDEELDLQPDEDETPLWI